MLFSTAICGRVERDRAVALVDLADEDVAARRPRALANGASAVTKFFITAPFMTVGSRPASCRIQPIMPVTVDLPLVPPTAMPRGAALNSCGEQLGARLILAQPTRARRDDVGHGVLDRRRGDQRSGPRA